LKSTVYATYNMILILIFLSKKRAARAGGLQLPFLKS